MIDLNKLVRGNVKKLIPYSCARDEFKGKTGIFMDANENPYGTLNRYPDPYQKELKSAISKVKGIEEEKIFLGNGSDEIIDLCYRIFCNPGIDKALTFTPTYGMYEVSASVNDVEVLKIPLNKDFQIDIKKAETLFNDKNLKLIFICSPNNPTANSMNREDVESILSRFNGIVIVDEAYIDFSEKPSLLSLVNKFPNLILMQTFSKAYGLAGVRVGIAFASKDIIQYFNKMKPPYNISALNQKAALSRLGQIGQFQKELMKIKKEKERLSKILPGIGVVEKVYPSDANFLLVKVNNANLIYNKLINKNIITRNRNGMVENCLRITIGRKSENDKLIHALHELANIM
jgi:histidinol-phosphate aminotransferase